MDFHGLFGLPTILGRIGDFLYKGTKKRTIGFGLGLGALVVSRRFTDVGLTLGQGLSGATGIFVVSFVGGLVLRQINKILCSKTTLEEEASGANLTEDMRKRRRLHHRNVLWDRVGQYAQWGYPPEFAASLQKDCEENLAGMVALTMPVHEDYLGPVPNRDRLIELFAQPPVAELAWKLCFDYGINHHDSQTENMALTDLDLWLVTDYYDGGLLHHTGNKLVEQWKANPKIRRAKKLAGFKSKGRKRLGRFGPGYETWYTWIASAYAFQHAKLNKPLEKKYNHNFNLEQFLIRSPEMDEAVAKAVARCAGPECAQEAVEELHAAQRRLAATVLVGDAPRAIANLHRAILVPFLNATDLRCALDVDYVAGDLDQTFESDAAPYAEHFRNIAGHVRAARERKKTVDDFLRRTDYADLANDSAQTAARQAVHCAAHANRANLAKLMGDSSPTSTQQALNAVAQAVQRQHEYARSLCTVRTFQTLTLFEIEIYEHYLQSVLA